MSKIPEEVIKAWENRNGSVILTTVDAEGTPNSIYASCVSIFKGSNPVVADNYFDKTRCNILGGSPASILFITEESKSYQLKGSIRYEKQGEIYDDMKSWNPKQHPGHAAAVLDVKEIYSGSEKLL